jgi:hypothetical protein
MKTITKTLLIGGIVVVAGLVTPSAQAYFYQPQYTASERSYLNQQYNNPYNYGYQDTASQLIQGQLNFVSNFTYIPSPIHSYFFQYYPSYNYFGNYGYNYGFGY